MPARDGMWLLRALRAEVPEVPVILLTGQASVSLAVHAIQEGAYDFIEKPIAAARLRLVLDRALQKRAAHREVELLRGRLAVVDRRAVLLGEAPATRALLDAGAPGGAGRRPAWSSRARAGPARRRSGGWCTTSPRAARDRSSR